MGKGYGIPGSPNRCFSPGSLRGADAVGAGLELPPELAGQDVQLLAAFGDGAAGEFDALQSQLFDQFLVAPQLGGVFSFDNFSEGSFDTGVRQTKLPGNLLC